jgi:hypothetical protein
MKDNENSNLIERIDNIFIEIYEDVYKDLCKNNREFIEMEQEAKKLQEDFPLIAEVIEEKGEVSLSVEECRALARCIKLQDRIEDIEYKQLYYRGHTDCFSYLKKIGAI